MKIPVLLVVAAAAIGLTFAIPEFGDCCRHRTAPTPAPEVSSTPVPCDSLSAYPCTLRVEAGPNTVVDRGHLALAEAKQLTGAYRYQQEQDHRVLYVYDEVQNLVSRVVDPKAVLLIDPLQ